MHRKISLVFFCGCQFFFLVNNKNKNYFCDLIFFRYFFVGDFFFLAGDMLLPHHVGVYVLWPVCVFGVWCCWCACNVGPFIFRVCGVFVFTFVGLTTTANLTVTNAMMASQKAAQTCTWLTFPYQCSVFGVCVCVLSGSHALSLYRVLSTNSSHQCDMDKSNVKNWTKRNSHALLPHHPSETTVLKTNKTSPNVVHCLLCRTSALGVGRSFPWQGPLRSICGAALSPFKCQIFIDQT